MILCLKRSPTWAFVWFLSPSRTYDAYSTFFLDSQGLINCHRVSKVSFKCSIAAGKMGQQQCSPPSQSQEQYLGIKSNFFYPVCWINIFLSLQLMPSQPPLNKLKKLVVASLLGLGLSDPRPSLQLLSSALAGKQQQETVGCRNSWSPAPLASLLVSLKVSASCHVRQGWYQ